ncbi:hypothetical protein RFI_08044 [Reticulomyxa filosa]|uniref:Uncharacterized protein n=1 Tax=Reticulomyxa filosa TaxID=46433 RepID=X6NSU6_RETFI|nr:hypothetical protein RFI_08044 [Reticulomyxa filosa]|eukprot:ETO29081.1 hypothetical protein RFI_08044 [Reticulomyxa filosa]
MYDNTWFELSGQIEQRGHNIAHVLIGKVCGKQLHFDMQVANGKVQLPFGMTKDKGQCSTKHFSTFLAPLDWMYRRCLLCLNLVNMLSLLLILLLLLLLLMMMMMMMMMMMIMKTKDMALAMCSDRETTASIVANARVFWKAEFLCNCGSSICRDWPKCQIST